MAREREETPRNPESMEDQFRLLKCQDSEISIQRQCVKKGEESVDLPPATDGTQEFLMSLRLSPLIGKCDFCECKLYKLW